MDDTLHASRGKVTLQRLALELGLSTATVSLALRDVVAHCIGFSRPSRDADDFTLCRVNERPALFSGFPLVVLPIDQRPPYDGQEKRRVWEPFGNIHRSMLKLRFFCDVAPCADFIGLAGRLDLQAFFEVAFRKSTTNQSAERLFEER